MILFQQRNRRPHYMVGDYLVFGFARRGALVNPVAFEHIYNLSGTENLVYSLTGTQTLSTTLSGTEANTYSLSGTV